MQVSSLTGNFAKLGHLKMDVNLIHGGYHEFKNQSQY